MSKSVTYRYLFLQLGEKRARDFSDLILIGGARFPQQTQFYFHVFDIHRISAVDHIDRRRIDRCDRILSLDDL